MAQIGDKVQNALDEARMLMLGTEVLIGFDFRAVLEHGFDQLPRLTQQLKVGGLGMMLITLGLLLWPGSYHQIVEQGEDSPRIHGFATRVMSVALLPFAIGLSVDVYTAFEKLFGQPAGLLAGMAGAGVALFFWYGLEAVHRHTGQHRHQPAPDNDEESNGRNGRMATPLDSKIRHVLTEARVVLPGAQALLGFQFIAMLAEGFEKLPETTKMVHVISLALVALSTVLLMTPAAYHRIVEQGEDSEHFHHFASRILLLAMVPLGLGLCGDFYLVIEKVSQSQQLAIGAASVLLAFFFGAWFGYTSFRRQTLGGVPTRPVGRVGTPSA